MYEIVRAYVQACPTCQRVKDCTTSKLGLMQPLPLPSARFTEYSMDFVFGLPECNSYTGILTIVDRATKRVTLRPVAANVTADDTAQLLFDGIIRTFGAPSVLLSDRDPRFMSDVWASITHCMDTRLVHSTAFHAQTDG